MPNFLKISRHSPEKRLAVNLRQITLHHSNSARRFASYPSCLLFQTRDAAAMASELPSGCCPDLGNVTCQLINDSACAVTGAGSEARSFDMPWWASLFWTVAFVVMLAIAIGGNSVVCWIILG